MPNELMQPLCGYQNQLNQSSQNNQMGKMVDQLHHSPISARISHSRKQATPTKLFDNCNTQGQLKYIKTDLISSTPRSQNIRQGTAKNRNSFNGRLELSATKKLTFSDQRLKECTIKPLPSPSINIMKPRPFLNLSLDQISQENMSSRTAKACEMTQQSNRGRPNQSPGAINRSKNLSVIDEIDELFQKNRKKEAVSRRQSLDKQQDASDGTLIQNQSLKNEQVDAIQSKNLIKNNLLTAATVTPPLRCADKQPNSSNWRGKEGKSLLHVNSEELQEPFERLQISGKEEVVGNDENNTLFNQFDKEMIVCTQNGDRIQNIQQKNKKANAINTSYYKGFQGLHHQHHLVQEQAAQISGNKTKSHLPDDFVHIKNFKNLDSMHANIRDNSPENLPTTKNTEQYFFDQAVEVGTMKQKVSSCTELGEKQEESRSLSASEASDTEFWPQDSRDGNYDSKFEEDLDAAQISKNKPMKKSRRQNSVITDLDSILMTDSIDQIVEVTPNNIIYNQCHLMQSRCSGGLHRTNGSLTGHSSKKKQNNQFRNQLNDQNQNQQKEQQNKQTAQQQKPMDQSDNYVSRVRISSLTRTHNQNQSTNSPEEDTKLQSFLNATEQGQGKASQQASYLAPQNWAQAIHPFQSKFTPFKLTGAQLDDPNFMVNFNVGHIGGNQTTPGSIASRFFGQNQQEFQQQSTQIPDDHEENIDEELVNFKSAIQQFNTISNKIQQQQNQQMNIIQRVMDDDLSSQNPHLLNASGFRQLNPFQVNNYLTTTNIANQQAINPATLEQAPHLASAQEDQRVAGAANAFARKSSVAATNPIMPMFMQKNPSSSKDNSGESSVPAATQNPLIRLRQEIRNQQTNQNLYEQIQHLAEQLKLSQQMMSVEGNEINIYQEDKMQMIQQLQAQIDSNKNKQLQHQQVPSVEPNRSQTGSQPSTGNFVQNNSRLEPQDQQQNRQQTHRVTKSMSFIEQQKGATADEHQGSLRLLQTIQEAKQVMSNSVIAGLIEQATLSNAQLDKQSSYQHQQDQDMPVKVQIMDDQEEGVICISRNKNIIKKRSFVEVQKTNQHESQGSGLNDRCLSEQKSSSRYKKKWAKSEYLGQSNQRMREESIEQEEKSDHQSVGQKSGSSHLRSAKSFRKKNIQMEKSAFSARRRFEDIMDDHSQDKSQHRNTGQMPISSFDLVTSQEQAQAHQSSQPSALQKMIGPLTISERHQRILKFIHKKHNKTQAKKFTYECRKSVAEKRLRIKGRFVTKQQAFQILGLKEDDIQSNEALQRLLEQHYNINNQTGTQLPFSNRMSQIMHFQLSKKQGAVLTGTPVQNQMISEDSLLQAKNGRSTIQVSSLIQNADGTNRTIKIRNFQALFDQAYSNQASLNDTTLNEAMMTGNEENSQEIIHSSSDSKDPDQQVRKLSTCQPPFSQVVLNCGQMSLLGSKMSMYNAASAGSSEYYSQQIGVLEMQQQLRIQDEQNASATNSLLEGLVQPPMFKVERMVENLEEGLLQQNGEGSERDGSYPNKYENDSESLCNEEVELEED